jgi:hypothetical protein
MTPAFPFVIVSAALALLVADGLVFGRENEDAFGWSMAASVSRTMRRGRGRAAVQLIRSGGR